MNETLVTRGDACAGLGIGRSTLADRMRASRMAPVTVAPEFAGDDGVRIREADVLTLGSAMYANFPAAWKRYLEVERPARVRQLKQDVAEAAGRVKSRTLLADTDAAMRELDALLGRKPSRHSSERVSKPVPARRTSKGGETRLLRLAEAQRLSGKNAAEIRELIASGRVRGYEFGRRYRKPGLPPLGQTWLIAERDLLAAVGKA